MTLKIYGIGPSRAARPIWTALELGVSFDLISTPYAGGATRTPEFLAINPNGHIPVLIDERAEGAITVWESMACALYIARVHGKADGQTIAPATPREEAEALRWSFWTVSELEADALTVLMHRMAMPEDQRKPELADKAESRLKVPLAVLELYLWAERSPRRGPKLAVASLLCPTVQASEVTVAVEYSTLNYKDGLCLGSGGGMVRVWPHVPGIDFAGTVEASDDPRYRAGDRVVLTGWRVGESWWGGFSEKARVKGDWLVPLPEGLTTQQAMAVGTAGLTAMLAVTFSSTDCVETCPSPTAA